MEYLIHRWMYPGLRLHGLRDRIKAYRLLYGVPGSGVSITIRGEWPSFGVMTRWQSIPVTRVGTRSIVVELPGGRRVSLPLLDGECGFTEIAFSITDAAPDTATEEAA